MYGQPQQGYGQPMVNQYGQPVQQGMPVQMQGGMQMQPMMQQPMYGQQPMMQQPMMQQPQPMMMNQAPVPIGAMVQPAANVVTQGAAMTLQYLGSAPGACRSLAWPGRGRLRRLAEVPLTRPALPGVCIRQNINVLGAPTTPAGLERWTEEPRRLGPRCPPPAARMLVPPALTPAAQTW